MEDPSPILEQLPAGKHALCACGQTTKAPFCDGSHQGTGLSPLIMDVGETGRTVAWCTCRTSDKLPMCDGRHKKLWKNPPPPKPGKQAPAE